MKKTIALILALVMLLSLSACGKTAEEKYPSFYGAASPLFLTPGLSDEFVPQGITYIDSLSAFCVCGYMTDGTSSPLFLLDKDGNLIKRLSVLNEDGSIYVGHAGGVVATYQRLWLSSGGKARLIDLSSVSDAKDGDSVSILKTFDTFNNASFVAADGSHLYFGEFYEKNDYQTVESHHITTPAGDKHFAIITMFNIEVPAESFSGITVDCNLVPCGAISVREKVQGFAVNNSQIVLSTSYGRKNTSNIFTYQNVVYNNQASGTLDFGAGAAVPLYYLDSSNLVSSLEAPPMTEGIVFYDGRLVVLFESGAKKYFDTAKYPQTQIFSLDLDKIG